MDALEPPTKKLKKSSSTIAAEILVSASSASESSVSDEVEECNLKSIRADGKKHVAKGTLTEADLLEAKRLARSKKPKEDMTEEEKKEERRASNRLSAFQSRQRRKIIIEGLQKTVAEISKDNAQQRKEKEMIKAELDAVKRENEILRCQLNTMVGSSSPLPNTVHVNQLQSLLSTRQPPSAAALLLQSLVATQDQPIDQARGLLNELMDIQRQALLQTSVTPNSTTSCGSSLQSMGPSASPSSSIAQSQQSLHLLAKSYQNANK